MSTDALVAEIKAALEVLNGGKGHLSEILSIVRQRGAVELPADGQTAAIRAAIEAYSSDSDKYDPANEDAFYCALRPGEGFWGLRSMK